MPDKKQTALQELIEIIDERIQVIFKTGAPTDYTKGLLEGMKHFKLSTLLLKRKEREQIIDAFDEGADRNQPIEGQGYFNETYITQDK